MKGKIEWSIGLKQNKKRAVSIVEELFEGSQDKSALEEFKAYELVDIEYVKEGKDRFLRVYVDKEGGISHDDCVMISRKISEVMDSIDPIKDAYILEISSPGIERPLKKFKDFERFSGEKVEVKLYAPIEGLGLKKFIGWIDKAIDNDVYIEHEETGEIVVIAFEKISSAKLVFTFE